jgi:hypothetical protein
MYPELPYHFGKALASRGFVRQNQQDQVILSRGASDREKYPMLTEP